MTYLVCHCREVRQFAYVEADSEEEAIEKAADNFDDYEWDIEDNDPGEYDIRETT